jgi:hypothetical protein
MGELKKEKNLFLYCKEQQEPLIPPLLVQLHNQFAQISSLIAAIIAGSGACSSFFS